MTFFEYKELFGPKGAAKFFSMLEKSSSPAVPTISDFSLRIQGDSP